MADSTMFAAYIRTAEARFPRGGRWLFFFWDLGIFVILVWAGRIRGVAAAAIFVLLMLSAAYLAWIFTKGGVKAFTADAGGLSFGPSRASPQRRQLAWADVQQLRISPMRGGVLLEVLISPGVPAQYRHVARQAASLAFTSVPFVGVRRCVPAVVLAERNPGRYRIPLIRITPDEVRSGLASAAPGTAIVTAS